MQFRVGINIGDVIYDEARIYGDGINIAARLEAIAEPGGVYVSLQAYDQVEGRDWQRQSLPSMRAMCCW
jgi:adenylate cyclase